MFPRVLSYLEEKKHAFRAWFMQFAQKPHAERWLAFFSFAEASFFPIPPDFLLAPLAATNHTRWIRLSIITSLASIAGGLAGYAIGFFFFEAIGAPVINFYGLNDAFAETARIFGQATFLTIFAAAFTPIPYKVFTIAAGFFIAPLAPFLLASFLGRSLRFALIGYLSHRYGAPIGGFLYRHFNAATLLVAVVLVVLAVLLA